MTLPGQLALRQVGKVGHTTPSHVQGLGPPGQLALWQVGKADKPLMWSVSGGSHLLTSVDPASRPRLHRGTVPGTVLSENGHRLPGQLALGQVGKVVVAVPAVCRVLGPPGQLALRQEGKAANTRTFGWSA